MENKDIGQFKNCRPHGYWEKYWYNGSLMHKCFYNNGNVVGYSEIYPNRDNKINNKIFYI